MPTLRETILAALHARLSALHAAALRGDVLPERVPTAGLLILRDGEPGEPEVTLSPLRYHYQHRAEIEAVVQGTSRDAAFDTRSVKRTGAGAGKETVEQVAHAGRVAWQGYGKLLGMFGNVRVMVTWVPSATTKAG